MLQLLQILFIIIVFFLIIHHLQKRSRTPVYTVKMLQLQVNDNLVFNLCYPNVT